MNYPGSKLSPADTSLTRPGVAIGEAGGGGGGGSNANLKGFVGF